MMSGGAQDGRLGAGDEALIERRLWILVGCIAAVFGVFGVRLFQLQIVQGASLNEVSLGNAVRSVRVEAPRGDIVDRDGRVLASSRPAFAVGIMPNELRTPERTYAALGSLIERPTPELVDAVGVRSGRARFQPVVLERDLTAEARARVETHRFAMPGVVTQVRPLRHYVEGARAAHALGTIGEIAKAQLQSNAFDGYRAGEIVGQSGLESMLESHLRGRAGGRNVVVDVAGRVVEVLDEQAPERGGRVVLTIDLDLQRAAEAAFLAPEPIDPEESAKPDTMGALVALDPRTGDVLAMVSRPSYDPNAFAGGIDGETWAALTGDRWRPLQNRAISGQYSPGSTYKAIVAAAGLEDGIVDPARTVFCPGFYRMGRRIYRCWRRGGHGDVDLREALAKSCDVYFYHLGVELGIDRIAHFAKGFGLGRTTGISLSGEQNGLVPTRDWKERARREEWIKGETVSAAIGQGYNLVTPIQLAVAYAAIANGGTVVQPRIVLRLESWDGRVVEQRYEGARQRVPIAPEHLALVREGLTETVEGEGATGGRARVRGMRVAGKTGTTQVVSLSAVEMYEEDEDIPIHLRDHAWFAAFAPAEAPEIAVAVLAEHGGGGGSVAAPIAQKVLQAYYDKHLAPPEERPGPPAVPSRPLVPERPDPAIEVRVEARARAGDVPPALAALAGSQGGTP